MHHGLVAWQLSVPEHLSHSVVTIRTILEDDQHCLKVALPHRRMTTCLWSMLDMENKTLDVALVKDAQLDRPVTKFE